MVGVISAQAGLRALPVDPGQLLHGRRLLQQLASVLGRTGGAVRAHPIATLRLCQRRDGKQQITVLPIRPRTELT